jgi:hypothetical protein
MHSVYRELIERQFACLTEDISAESVLSPPVMSGTRVVVRVEGIRKSGEHDRYLLCIDTDRFPVEPFDVGFIDPSLPATQWDRAELKNPTFFPNDGDDGQQRMKTAFHTDPRVFICIQPGFTREYFAHHRDESWNPHAMTLAHIVQQVRNVITSPRYVGPMWEKKTT